VSAQLAHAHSVDTHTRKRAKVSYCTSSKQCCVYEFRNVMRTRLTEIKLASPHRWILTTHNMLRGRKRKRL
jgi:hypothetical protein